MKQIGILINIFSLLIFNSCEWSNSNPSVNQNNEHTVDQRHKDSINSPEILDRDSDQNIKHDPFKALKKIVLDENKLRYSADSIIVSNADSLVEYHYIKNLFEVEKIDSIEIYGRLENKFYLKRHPELNSLIIIYFNNQEVAEEEYAMLEQNQFDDWRGAEDIFKAGGISFVLSSQLCLYPIDGCGPGFKNIERIDSIIFRNVFNNEKYDRLLDRCGLHKYLHLVD